jgi:hypothetical protein
MTKPLVTWFANPHEHSVHFIKFGLMQLERRGEIRFQEIPNHLAAGVLPERIASHSHRRTAAALLRDGHTSKVVVFDGEDSIFQTSPLLTVSDYYFVCAFHRRFFEGEPFAMAYAWQDGSEVDYYRKLYGKLQDRFRPYLCKARPIVPIGPELESEVKLDFSEQRLHNLRHRIRKTVTRTIDWLPQYERFEKRWGRLEELRTLAPRYDVVLKDSLWGWPRHRIALHRKLAELSEKFEIRAELDYRQPEAYELGKHPSPDPEDFPVRSGAGITGDYEEMLAASRLGVFATGFHWGCRNVVTLAWFLGLPVYMDKPVFEAIYDFDNFSLFYNETGNWSEMEEHLKRSKETRAAEKKKCQAVFDRIAGPAVAARHILSTVFN